MSGSTSNWEGSRPKRTANGARWRKIVKAVLAREGSVCIVCAHGGAEAGDHVLPVAEYPELEWDVGNIKPIHHKPCPVCTEAAGRNVRCNYIKGYGTLDRARRIVAELTSLDVSRETRDDPDAGWW